MAEIPTDVVEYVRDVFAGCNIRTTEKLSRSPNVPEESLDLSWIEHVSRYAAAVSLPSQWLVKVETHYLGGMRHFHRWEIADIGVLVHLRLGRDDRWSKVALLQSKRLYPSGTPVREETRTDFQVGFARLADPEDAAMSIGFATEFRFSAESAYGQIRRGSDQVAAIDDYERDVQLRVYYQLYNPWTVPFVQTVPLVAYTEQRGEPELGIRVVPAGVVHARLATSSPPRLGEFAELAPLPAFGWRLEEFICDQVLTCHQGDRFESVADQRIQRLFNRRSGAIAAAIAVTIEAPAQAA